MEDTRKSPLIPNFKKELGALGQRFGPGWMLAALIVVCLPFWLLGGGFFMRGLAALVRVLK
jgi:hypothetical protein